MKAVLGLAILSLLLFTVWEHAEMVQLGYEIERLKREHLHHEKRQQALLAEYYRLVSPDRVEALAAANFGFVRPHPGQVVMMSRP